MKIKGNIGTKSNNLYYAFELLIKKYPELVAIREKGKSVTDTAAFYRKHATVLCKELKFPNYWSDLIYRYLMTNKLNVPEDTIGVKYDNKTGEILVSVNNQTTLQEYKQAWKEVKTLTKLKSSIKKPVKIRPVDFIVVFSKLHGNKKLTEITEELQLNEYFETSKSVEDANVRKIFLTMKKKLGLM